jgi:cytochrome P450
VIPAHTTIGMPAQAINMDPELYPDPETFDGLRFHDLKAAGASASKTDYVASNGASLNFGYGRHACPGRWFAANEIKCIMICLLTNYDISFSEGQERPKNLQVETQNLPNPIATVLSRKIRRQ